MGEMLAAGLLAPIFSRPYAITVMSYGLTAPRHYQGLERLWTDAQLFAITRGKLDAPATRYELAAENWSVE
jgi:hypothetical protein